MIPRAGGVTAVSIVDIDQARTHTDAHDGVCPITHLRERLGFAIGLGKPHQGLGAHHMEVLGQRVMRLGDAGTVPATTKASL